jgi:pyruvate formate lyase activating enzyme
MTLRDHQEEDKPVCRPAEAAGGEGEGERPQRDFPGHELSRRDFFADSLRGLFAFGTAACVLSCAARLRPLLAAGEKEAGKSEEDLYVKEALHWKKLEQLKVECLLCPRKCRVADLERGSCGVRENRKGTYYTLVHSRVCAAHIDPIEKKPLFHFRPGTLAFSVATAGCNMACKFCQNWEISQFRPEQVASHYLPPKRLAEIAKARRCRSIAYTYTEPVVFYEYMLDCAREGNKLGMDSVMISNGYILEKPLVELCRELKAVKVDLKAFTEKFYRESCDGKLKPVLEGLETLKKIGIWFELVVLLIPTLNDGEKEIKELSAWVRRSLGPDVPVHFTRFHPTYRLKNLPRTPVETLEKAREIAKAEGLRFVYLGNVPGHEGESTYCPKCGKTLIRRWGFYVLKNSLKEGRCDSCNEKIPGVW